jgi:hypothetical protein
VVVSDVLADGDSAAAVGGSSAELPAGVHHFRQLADWITTTAAHAQRTV